MLKRLLTTTVVLGFLVCGATIALEAVGLLFHVGVPDPEQRVEAFLAQLEADLHPADLPTEPVEVPSETEQERPGPGAQHLVEVEPMQLEGEGAHAQPRPQPGGHGDEPLAVAPDNEDQEGLVAQVAVQPDAGRELLPPEAEERGPAVRDVPVERTVEAAARAASHQSRDCAGSCEAKSVVLPPASRRSRPARPKSTRASVGSGGPFGCPVLDWLDAVMVAPFASAAGHSPADRRATL